MQLGSSTQDSYTTYRNDLLRVPAKRYQMLWGVSSPPPPHAASAKRNVGASETTPTSGFHEFTDTSRKPLGSTICDTVPRIPSTSPSV